MAVAPRCEGSEQRGGRCETIGGWRPLVLIIDDDVEPSNPLVTLLALDGFAVDCVQTGYLGLQRALNERHAALVIDLRLPDVPGLTVLHQVRDAGITTPIVTITGWYLEDGDENAARAIGVYEYLRKPVCASDLSAVLWRAIGVRETVADRPSNGMIDVSHAPSLVPRLCEEANRVDTALDLRSGEDENGRYGPGANRLVSERLPALQRRLRAKFTHASEHSITTAVHDALLDWLERLRRGDNLSTASLDGFLYTASWRNLTDSLRSESRRRRREDLYAAGRPSLSRLPEAEFANESGELRRRLDALSANEAESRGLFLWLEGAGPHAIAVALGCSQLGVDEQRREVKRFKDRILLRARRTAR